MRQQSERTAHGSSPWAWTRAAACDGGLRKDEKEKKRSRKEAFLGKGVS